MVAVSPLGGISLTRGSAVRWSYFYPRFQWPLDLTTKNKKNVGGRSENKQTSLCPSTTIVDVGCRLIQSPWLQPERPLTVGFINVLPGNLFPSGNFLRQPADKISGREIALAISEGRKSKDEVGCHRLGGRLGITRRRSKNLCL